MAPKGRRDSQPSLLNFFSKKNSDDSKRKIDDAVIDLTAEPEVERPPSKAPRIEGDAPSPASAVDSRRTGVYHPVQIPGRDGTRHDKARAMVGDAERSLAVQGPRPKYTPLEQQVC